MNETKVCKHCQTEIPKKAKVCPQCRKKQGGIGKWIVIALVVFTIIGVAGGGSEDGTQSGNSGNQSNNNQTTNTEKEYIKCTVDEMAKLLEENALKAENTYQDKYVEVTGKLSVIDSDGNYIALTSTENPWSFINVQCYIKNDEQLQKVMELKTDDIVTIKGKITDIGEVLGYQLDIESIN